MIEITSKENQSFKEILQLRRRKYRSKWNKFVIEGERSIDFMLRRQITPQSIWMSESYYHSSPSICETFSGPVYCVADALFAKLTDTESPQGILAVCRHESLPQADLSRAQQVLVLDRIQDPGNAGTLLRIATAVNCQAVLTTVGTVDLLSPKVIRSSMGVILQVPIRQGLDEEEIWQMARAQDMPVIVTALSDSTSYAEMPGFRSGLWVFGNEGNGVSDFWLAKADHRYFIPMENQMDSLNVAIAGAVFLFHNRYLTECSSCKN